jgi:hypothetical protein
MRIVQPSLQVKHRASQGRRGWPEHLREDARSLSSGRALLALLPGHDGERPLSALLISLRTPGSKQG